MRPSYSSARTWPRAAALLAALVGSLWLAAPVAAAEPLAERIDRHLRTKSSGPFSGVVLVSQFGQRLFHRAYGYADAELAVPNTPGTRFAIASLTKPITAAAVLRQVEAGQMRLDASICDYVADCPAAWRRVTIEHLLSHSSGLPDLFEEISAASPEGFRAAIDEAVAAHGDRPLAHRPGSAYAYNNFGYFLLGYALEIATGESWENAVRAAVLTPAEMADTRFGEDRTISPRPASGYRRIGPNALIAAPYRSPAAYAAGGLVATAEDLLRFDAALSNGKIVSRQTLRGMTTPRHGRYGLGWQIVTVLGKPQRNHTGQLPGFASHMARYDDGTLIVLLSNLDNEPAQETACDLAALTFGLAPSPPGTPTCRRAR
ncbi:MAG TPA: serine hydrolase domain-containing protein [Allosphingosinicella sp.]|nr:serine hydrolase domain-containing protein [Allosphingosinicella sp.]